MGTSASGDRMATAAQSAPSFAANRPGAGDTWKNRLASALDRDDAPSFALRKVVTQAAHDLFGTKDVQNVITASYVWLADQLGHLTLGLGPTLLLCWLVAWLAAWLQWPGWAEVAAMVGAALAIFVWWVSKERQDFRDTAAQAGGVFPFNAADIDWNVRTALTYFATGGLLGLTAFLGFWLFAVALLISIWPVAMVALWWLRRKLAFQQAGLPYLYRLANFTGVFDRPEAEPACAAVAGLCDLGERPVSFLDVLMGRDLITHEPPPQRHLLVSGPLRSGKTSLAVGIGTEFAFRLGIGRYLAATDLVELAAIKPVPDQRMEYDDGRVLWPWNEVALLIVDDLDAAILRVGLEDSTEAMARLGDPDRFARALRASGQMQPLAWLRDRRSVWVIGDPDSATQWQGCIGGLMGADADEITAMVLTTRPDNPPSAASSD